ncbi:unnamed protein product [Tilletia controversa]|nr:hypothetical protein CF335_g7592 [Tilletia laevis]CAD6885200.1 unnamed protein product [Tilletia caries]CAD6924504.1 unnamed protein product [Tilletia controversa]KAE8200573.1 hypothetical protein CF336_g628 [Tilletia laevis]CAD6931251.1 unnamed protein product [Tilletia controversa]
MRLSITTDATQVLLSPHRRSTETTPLLVQVHLQLGPHERPPSRLTSLTISLQRFENLEFNNRPESTVFEPIKASFDVSDRVLLPGTVHTWQARLEIPHTAAAYNVIQNNKSQQYLLAAAHYQSRLRLSRMITAKKELYLIPQPAVAADSDPFCYTHVQTGAHDGIGPVLIQVQAQHLTIGGMIRVRAQFPAPSPLFRLSSVEFAIDQKVTLRSRKIKGVEQELPSRRLVLLHQSTSKLETDGWLLRMPSCAVMRPSSESKRLGIDVEHLFTARFTFYMLSENEYQQEQQEQHADHTRSQDGADTQLTKGEKKQRKATSSSSSIPQRHVAYTLAWSIHVPSCALRWESILLPAYSETDPSPVPEADRTEIASRKSGRRLCVCGKEQEELLALDELMAKIHDIPDDRNHFDRPESQLADKLRSNYACCSKDGGWTTGASNSGSSGGACCDGEAAQHGHQRRCSALSSFSHASSCSSGPVHHS